MLERPKRIISKEIIAVVLLISFIAPILYACIYAVPSRDDFINSVGWMEYEDGHIKYLFAAAWYLYRNFQGTYFGSFISSFPTYYLFGFLGLRIWFLLNAIFFFLSFFCFMYHLCTWLRIDKQGIFAVALWCSVIIFFYVLCIYDFCDEIFYWYTGACMYTVPLSFSLLAISCYFKYEGGKKNRYLIIGSLFALCGSGGILAIPAFLNTIILLLVVYDLLVRRTVKKNICIGCCAFVGALLNAFAPGNLARASDKLDYLATCINVIRRLSRIYSQDIENGSLLLVIAIAFIIGASYLGSVEFEFSHPVAIVALCMLGPGIIDVPIFLARAGSSSVDYLGNRYEFVEHFSVAICLVFASLYTAGWFKQTLKFEISKVFIITILVICFIQSSYLIDVENFIELTPYHMIQHMIINDNDFKKYSTRQKNIIEQIEKSEVQDVVVETYRKQSGEWCNLSLIGLTDNEDDLWYSVNRYLARYYGKNSVTLVYIE